MSTVLLQTHLHFAGFHIVIDAPPIPRRHRRLPFHRRLALFFAIRAIDFFAPPHCCIICSVSREPAQRKTWRV